MDNIQQRKIQLIDKIIHLDKESLIEKIESLFSSEDISEELSINEIKLIQKGRKDFKNNLTSSNEDVKNRIKQQFNFS
ncbi:hypothetical protein UJ101_01434 [Flavobacteriaceae bacterium UJ101]|nr:hypothetical protein UJ101_01434 [Flavobacteriaceae bacterium UJ101]